MSKSEEKLFGKYNEIVLILLGFLLTGVAGTYIAQTYTTKNAELSAANKIFSEYSKLAGDRYFTMNQIMLAHSENKSDAIIEKRWLAYRSELQQWNTARGYNRQMLMLYFGQPIWNKERDIHYLFRAWGMTLEKAKNKTAIIDYSCLIKKRNQFLVTLHSFNFSLGEAIQQGKIGGNKSGHIINKNPRPEPLCLTNA